MHNERQLVKVVGPIVEIQEQYALPNDIDQHAFSKFTNIYFKVIICARDTIVNAVEHFSTVLVCVSVARLGYEKRTD